MSKKFRMLNEQDLESSINESKIRSGWGNNFLYSMKTKIRYFQHASQGLSLFLVSKLKKKSLKALFFNQYAVVITTVYASIS